MNVALGLDGHVEVLGDARRAARGAADVEHRRLLLRDRIGEVRDRVAVDVEALHALVARLQHEHAAVERERDRNRPVDETLPLAEAGEHRGHRRFVVGHGGRRKGEAIDLVLSSMDREGEAVRMDDHRVDRIREPSPARRSDGESDTGPVVIELDVPEVEPAFWIRGLVIHPAQRIDEEIAAAAVVGRDDVVRDSGADVNAIAGVP
jgi:hypothetical protein